jgi:hypothetical protein
MMTIREQFEETLPSNSGLLTGHIIWNEQNQQYESVDADHEDEASGLNLSLAARSEYSVLRKNLWFVTDSSEMSDLQKVMPRVYEELLNATADTGSSGHNTSCTYQFELAFHNLQDTPELRKIYWSALGQLQFDSNDQVIPPELEECPCCKAGEQ